MVLAEVLEAVGLTGAAQTTVELAVTALAFVFLYEAVKDKVKE